MKNVTDLFNIWYRDPIRNLMTNNDNAFIVFIATLPLYERYIVYRVLESNSEIVHGRFVTEGQIVEEIAKHMNIQADVALAFRKIFRNGLLHQGMVGIHNQRPHTLNYEAKHWPVMSFLIHTDYNWFPQVESRVKPKKHFVITIDPIKFAAVVLEAYESHPKILTYSRLYALATIFNSDS